VTLRQEACKAITDRERQESLQKQADDRKAKAELVSKVDKHMRDRFDLTIPLIGSFVTHEVTIRQFKRVPPVTRTYEAIQFRFAHSGIVLRAVLYPKTWANYMHRAPRPEHVRVYVERWVKGGWLRGPRQVWTEVADLASLGAVLRKDGGC
jgi:hypothetical protein